MAANLVAVWLAREGHDGPIGINFLRKIEMPMPGACYGAILAGVDAVFVGAGNTADLPPLLRSLARHEDERCRCGCRPSLCAVQVLSTSSSTTPRPSSSSR